MAALKLWIFCFLFASFSNHLQCQQSILKCYGDFFSETLCSIPTFIEVQSADYGITGSSDGDPTTCDPDDRECWDEVQEVKPTYYQTILDKCNGNRRCDNLQADWSQIHQCSNVLSDYVEIFYRCVTDISTTTTPTVPSTTGDIETTTTSLVSTPTTTAKSTTGVISTVSATTGNNSISEIGNDEGGLSGGAIAGIVIGVFLGAGLIVLVVILVVISRINPDFASQAKTTVMKPFTVISDNKGTKKKRSRTNSSSSSTSHGDASTDILRHPKLKIRHQNAKMNRDTSCSSGVGAEIILTPQQAGANDPHTITIDTLHAPKPSIEIVSTPQEAIRRINTNLPNCLNTVNETEENTYEEFDDYDEFNDRYEEYAEISDFEKRNEPTRKKKPSLKPKPKPNQNHYEGKLWPQEQSFSQEIMNHIKKRKKLEGASGDDTARSSTVEMTENDDLYYNADDVNADYQLAAKVDETYTEADDDNKYYDLQLNKKQMSLPRKYEQLQYRDEDTNGSQNDIFPSRDNHAPQRPQRKSQDIYDDYGEYYDDDEWSTEDSAEEYMEDENVRPSVLAMQDGHKKQYNRKMSTDC